MQSAPQLSETAQPHFALERLDEAGRSEFLAALALRHTRGLGQRSAKLLLEHFGSAHSALRHPRDWGAAGVRPDRTAQFNTGSWRTGAKEEWERARRLKAEILLWTDPRYPEHLKELPDAPTLLYCKGDTALLRSPCLAVVGSRRCSADGLDATRQIVSRLAACGITIVSGLALGIDRQAHLAALPQPGKTIAVLGTGIDIVYPGKNAELFSRITADALALTEFMPGARPETRHFPIRNRLISGLSLGVLVMEAADKSGSLITARLALEQNREVYAVPVSVFNPLAEGCRELIRRGAHAVFSAEDILLDLAPRLKEYGMLLPSPDLRLQPVSSRQSQPPAATVFSAPLQAAQAEPTEQSAAATRAAQPRPGRNTRDSAFAQGDQGRILGILRDEGACHIDVLARRLDLPAARLSSLLVQMELRALVRRLPGMSYAASL